MTIIGDRHYNAAPGERITFTVLSQTNVASITTPTGASLPLTVTVPASGHQTVTITVGFVPGSGGSAEIEVTGSLGGSDTSRIRQLAAMPNRSAFFTID
jgi:hypothetical protein